MQELPSLQLNSNNQVSSLWVAKACDIRHADVRRDILNRCRIGKEFNANLHETREIPEGGGRPAKVIWLSIPQSLILMTSYEGERAKQARDICLSFLDSSFAQNIPGYKPQHKELYEGTRLEVESYDDENDIEFQKMKQMRELMTKQMQNHIEIRKINKRISSLEDKTKQVDNKIDILNEQNEDSGMTNQQIEQLDMVIHKVCVQKYGSVFKVAGHIKRDLKKNYFKVASTRTYKEIPRRHFNDVLKFVETYEDTQVLEELKIKREIDSKLFNF